MVTKALEGICRQTDCYRTIMVLSPDRSNLWAEHWFPTASIVASVRHGARMERRDEREAAHWIRGRATVYRSVGYPDSRFPVKNWPSTTADALHREPDDIKVVIQFAARVIGTE